MFLEVYIDNQSKIVIVHDFLKTHQLTDRNDPVELALEFVVVENGDVAGEHLHVLQSPNSGFGHDELPLRRRVAQRDDLNFRELFCDVKSDASPATAEIEDGHSLKKIK
jgi:hypothetical protein